MFEIFRRFLGDRSGTFAVTAAIIMVPVMLAAGAALDFTMAVRVRAQLQDAADAAAVGAVAVSSPAFQKAGTMTSDGTIDVGVTDALKLFKVQLTDDTRTYVTKVDANVTKSGTEVTAVVTYKANVPTSLMRLAGFDTVPVSGSATARNGTPEFSDFYLLLDNTPSMGLGATPTDISRMVANTPDACAFACHTTNDPKNNYYQIAQNLGITMRFDVVREAVSELMDTAARTQTYPDQFEMGLYDFGAAAEHTGLTRIVKLSSSFTKVQNAVNGKSPKVDLMTIPEQNYNNDQQTDYNSVLSAMDHEIPDPGSGTNQDSRLKYLFFVADGVADYSNASSCQKKTTGGRCQEPINTSYCDALKKRGVQIAILYTTYYPLPSNSWYNTWIAPFASQIGTNMQKCASPGLFFEVSPTDGISEAMTALFKKIVAHPRLTN